MPDVSGLYTVRVDNGPYGRFNLDIQYTPDSGVINPARGGIVQYNEVAASSDFSFGYYCANNCLIPTAPLTLDIDFNWIEHGDSFSCGGRDLAWDVFLDSVSVNLAFNPSSQLWQSAPTLMGHLTYTGPVGCAPNEYFVYNTYLMSFSGCASHVRTSTEVLWDGAAAPCLCGPVGIGAPATYDGTDASVVSCYGNPQISYNTCEVFDCVSTFPTYYFFGGITWFLTLDSFLANEILPVGSGAPMCATTLASGEFTGNTYSPVLFSWGCAADPGRLGCDALSCDRPSYYRLHY